MVKSHLRNNPNKSPSRFNDSQKKEVILSMEIEIYKKYAITPADFLELYPKNLNQKKK